MEKLGISRATIAAVEKCTVAYVGMLINGGTKEGGSPDSTPDTEPPQPHRLSRRTAQVRAWEYAEQHMISKLGLAVDAFWVRIVVAIHQEGDGYCLHIGQPGCRFRSRDDLVDLFGRRAVEIKDWVALLVERGRLIDIDGIDIGIPHGMKLTPAENIRAKPGAKPSARPPQDGQEPMLYSVPGGLSDATEIPPQAQIKSQLNLHSRATETPILVVADGFARSVNVDVDVQENQQLDININKLSRVDADATEMGVSVASNANLIPPAGATEIPPSGATEINLQRSSLADLTAFLAGLVKPGRRPGGDEIGFVGSWLEMSTLTAEATTDLIQAVIVNRVSFCGAESISTLKYFNSEVRKALAAAAHGPKAAVAAKPPATPPLSAADAAVKARIDALLTSWHASKSGPMPPTFVTFQSHCTAGRGVPAHRWLSVIEEWRNAGCPSDLRPPDFGAYVVAPGVHELEMIEIEDALTNPDLPEASG